jgi:hypothetical protein
VYAAACSRDITGSAASTRGFIVIRGPVFAGATGTGLVDDKVQAIRVTISTVEAQGAPGHVIADVVPNIDTLNGTSGNGNDSTAGIITVGFPIQGAGVTYSVLLKAINTTGETTYVAGPATFSTGDISTGGAVTLNLTPVYIGPGSNAVTVVASPQTVNLVVGGANNSFQFTAQAYDAAGAALPEALYKWSSLDSTIAQVGDNTGLVFAFNTRGTARIVVVAMGATRPADTVTVNVALPASGIVADSGATPQQSARVNTTLATVIVVRVTASDGLAAPGVVVQFQTQSSGSASPNNATTDAAGRARTTWTLGSATGTQSMNVSIQNAPTLTIFATATP